MDDLERGYQEGTKFLVKETGKKYLQEMCEKPTPLGVGWIAQIMCM